MIKKKRKSRDWYRFDEQIWCNFSRDKNLTKRHAIQGSMKNTRFSGGMEKGVKVSFSRGTNEFSSLPSWVRFNGIFFAWVKKKNRSKTWKLFQFWFFTNIASIWDFCGFNNILGFGTVFFSTRWKKKTVQIIAPSLFPGSIAINVHFRKQKKPYPFGITEGYFTKSEFE